MTTPSNTERTASTITELLAEPLGLAPKDVPPLQRLVADRMAELGLTQRQVAKRSRRHGAKGISHITVHEIVTGKRTFARTGTSENTIQSLARALDLPVEQVREAANKSASPGASRPVFHLHERFRALNVENRNAVSDFADRLLVEQLRADHAETALNVILTAARRLPPESDALATLLRLLADGLDENTLEGAAQIVDDLIDELEDED